jgi:hypothetical protein
MSKYITVTPRGIMFVDTDSNHGPVLFKDQDSIALKTYPILKTVCDIPDGYTVEVSPDDEICWRAGDEYPLYAKLVKINDCENCDCIKTGDFKGEGAKSYQCLKTQKKWEKLDEPVKQSFIDRKKLHECILKDDILVSMRSQVEQLLKDIDKRYAYLIDLYKDL